jgi:hypothetical protein
VVLFIRLFALDQKTALHQHMKSPQSLIGTPCRSSHPVLLFRAVASNSTPPLPRYPPKRKVGCGMQRTTCSAQEPGRRQPTVLENVLANQDTTPLYCPWIHNTVLRTHPRASVRAMARHRPTSILFLFSTTPQERNMAKVNADIQS